MQNLPEASILDNSLFRALVNQVSALSRSVVGPNATFAEVEEGALQIANLAVREHLRRDLQRRSDALGEELWVDGKHVRRHHEGTVEYHSLNGPLPVRRFTFREVGVRNGPTLVPLELAAGLVEGGTPAFCYSVTLGYAQGDLRSYEESMGAAHRVLPSRSTLERLAKAIGTEAKSAAPRIEAYLRQSEVLPEGAHAASLGLDRVATPMEEDREEGAEPKTRRKRRTKPYVRVKPKPIDVNYRMAYVGTFSLWDADAEELVTRRYTALPDEGPADVVRRMMLDLRNAKRGDPSLKVGIVQDAADELWTAVTEGLKAEGLKGWSETIDRWHLNERLGKILRIVEPKAEAARTARLSEWNDRLDASDAAIGEILEWLGQQLACLEQRRSGETVDEYLVHMVFLEKNQHRMRYHSTRKKGLPIGSGLTEGACKSVVGQRACGSGQRWRPAGLSAALTLRAIHRSERLPGFWTHLSRRYTAEIRRAA